MWVNANSCYWNKKWEATNARNSLDVNSTMTVMGVVHHSVANVTLNPLYGSLEVGKDQIVQSETKSST